MPPSGFNVEHTVGIADFFSTCLRDLIEEGKKYNLPATQAVKREIENIETDPQKKFRGPASKATLDLIRTFYADIYQRRDKINSYDQLRDVGKEVSNKLLREIEAIRIGESVST